MTALWTRGAAAALALSLSAACGSITPPVTAAARPSAPAVAQDSPDLVRRFVARLPIGTTVTVTLMNRTRLSGMLMEIQDAAVVIKRRTRIPEAARSLAFSDIATIEPESSTGNTVKAAVLGAAAGAAAVIGVLIVLVAHSG
jgi:hypothetical protein